MSAYVALNAAFVRLGFSVEAAMMLADPTRESIDLEALQMFDDKGVKTLCATLRKPGGTIKDDGTVIRIPNP